MATRFYLPASGSPAVTPAAWSTGWEKTTGAGWRPTDTTKSNTALADTANTGNGVTANDSAVVGYVSPALASGVTITGTFSAVVKGLESNANFNGWQQVIIRVVSGDGVTVRGTLYAGSVAVSASATASAENGEWTTSAATRIKSAIALSSVDASAGDRITIELGARQASTRTDTITLNLGDPTAAADFALTSALTTNLCPWVELSQTLTFAVPMKNGSATGTWAFAGTASGARTPKAASTGTWTFVGTAAGARTPKASSSGSWSFTGTAAGTAPAVGPEEGAATGSWSFTGTAAGARTPQATGTGTAAFSGSAAGSRAPQAAGTGTAAFTGTAVGARTPKATATGTITFTGVGSGTRTPKASGTGSWAVSGAAEGAAPVVGQADGSGSGTWALNGTAAGTRTPKASSTGTWAYTGTAAGSAPSVGGRAGSGEGQWAYAGTAVAQRTPKASASGTWAFSGTVSGPTTGLEPGRFLLSA